MNVEVVDLDGHWGVNFLRQQYTLLTDPTPSSHDERMRADIKGLFRQVFGTLSGMALYVDGRCWEATLMVPARSPMDTALTLVQLRTGYLAFKAPVLADAPARQVPSLPF